MADATSTHPFPVVDGIGQPIVPGSKLLYLTSSGPKVAVVERINFAWSDAKQPAKATLRCKYDVAKGRGYSSRFTIHNTSRHIVLSPPGEGEQGVRLSEDATAKLVGPSSPYGFR